MNRILTVLACLAGSTAHAAEYRAITLSNGRVVHAEIAAITAESIELNLRQGQMFIDHGELKNMAPMSAAEFAALPPWRVVVLPFATADEPESGVSPLQTDADAAGLLSMRVLASIDGVEALTPDSLPGVPEPTRRALALCGTDLQCAVRHGAEARADVVVMGGIEAGDSSRRLTIGAVFVDAPGARGLLRIDYDRALLDSRDELYAAQYTVLALQPPEVPMLIEEVVVAPDAPAPPPRAPKVAGPPSVWMPVPGYPALMRRDYTGFGTALAAVGVGTFATVHTAGHATWSAPQMTVMSALTSYGLTVAVNHMFDTQ